jgi:hypothetical protein
MWSIRPLATQAATWCWPCKSNSVRVGSYVSRARGASGDCGLSAGVLAAGPVETPSSSRARARLRLLPVPEPQPFAELCDEIGHSASLRRSLGPQAEPTLGHLRAVFRSREGRGRVLIERRVH